MVAPTISAAVTPRIRAAAETMNKARNTVVHGATPPDCMIDQSSPKVVVPNNDRINRSALTMRYQGTASAATSTRMKNQNQYPPENIPEPLGFRLVMVNMFQILAWSVRKISKTKL